MIKALKTICGFMILVLMLIIIATPFMFEGGVIPFWIGMLMLAIFGACGGLIVKCYIELDRAEKGTEESGNSGPVQRKINHIDYKV